MFAPAGAPVLKFPANGCNAAAPLIWTVRPEHAMLAASTPPLGAPVMLTLQVEVCAVVKHVRHAAIKTSAAAAFI